MTNRIDANTLDRAIKALAGTTNVTDWVDASHLTSHAGRQVLLNDADTVKLLTTLVASKRTDFDVVDLQVWADTLVYSDQALVEKAIAGAAGNKSKAETDFAKGNASANANNAYMAIQDYGKGMAVGHAEMKCHF